MNAFRQALLASSILAVAAVFLPLDPALAVESQTVLAKYFENYVVLADGTYTATYHREMLAKTTAAAREIGKVSLEYDEIFEDEPQVTEAYTLKKDGTKLIVDTSAIYTQAVSDDDTDVSSGKEKLIVFPKVAAGDTVVYTATFHQKATPLPGYFDTSFVFSRILSYGDATGIISAPKDLPLRFDAHGVSVEEEERGNFIHYRWHYSAPDALPEDVADIAESDRNPRIFLSSFASYDDLGRAYAEMTAPALKVTAKVQAQADTITAGITDRRVQAEKIYEWVSQNIQYVSIDLGIGGYMPHSADAVLANGYGDCKDHSALLAALLKAKGIDSNIVLIDLDNQYTVPGVPALVFNHAINWLPEFGVYVDSTAGVAPFGTLSYQEYGKPVLHLVASGGALRKTPIVAPGEASMVVKTTAKLDADGKLTGETLSVARGPAGVDLRLDAEDIETNGVPDMGSDATGTYDFESPRQLASEYRMLGRFEYAKPEYLEGSSMVMNALTTLPYVGDWLMGPFDNAKLKNDEPTRCFTGTAVYQATLELPAGKRLLKLPRDVTVVTGHLRYTTRWAMDGQVVSLKRTFVSVIDQPLCSGQMRKSTAKALTQIHNSYRTEVLSLVDAGAGT